MGSDIYCVIKDKWDVYAVRYWSGKGRYFTDTNMSKSVRRFIDNCDKVRTVDFFGYP